MSTTIVHLPATAAESGPSTHSSPRFPAQTAVSLDDDVMCFDSYCVVCDRLIQAPREPERVKTVKKKAAGGTIRVRNPDGTFTTRTASGKTVTRPPLKRNPTSNSRLAVAAANNAVAKLQPLTRSKTAESVPAASDGSPDSQSPSPQPVSPEPLDSFKSSIYCSKECQAKEAARSAETYSSLARNMSYDFTSAYPPHPLSPLERINTNLSANPYAPPSPLFMSDVESASTSTKSGGDARTSTDSNPPVIQDGPVSSAPKIMEYFQMYREQPDEAWHENQRQRRLSMQPHAMRPMSMLRQQSQQSHHSQASYGGPSTGEISTDSLSSMWDDSLARSTSGNGRPRASSRHARTSISNGSDRSPSGPAPVPLSSARPNFRTNPSQTSLILPSPTEGWSAEFGSQPKHTLSLYQSYLASFGHRDISSPKPVPQYPASLGLTPNPRRPSLTNTPSLGRPSSGTIRARRSDAAEQEKPLTWDSFAKHESDVINQRTALKRVGAVPIPCSLPKTKEIEMDSTPKQSYEMKGGKWVIRYHTPKPTPDVPALALAKRAGDRSSISVHSNSSSGSGGSSRVHIQPRSNSLAVPKQPALSSSQSTAGASRTPQNSMPPPSYIPTNRRGSAHLSEDMSALRLGQSPRSTTALTAEHALGASVPNGNGSIKGFSWEKLEKQGKVKVMELPMGLKVERKGLFYFE